MKKYYSKHKFSLLACVLLSAFSIQSQSIRKSWTEFTSQERLDYINSINSLTRATVQNLPSEHRRLMTTGIHSDDGFLPWHRIFIQYFEDELKKTNENISLPYWDWHENWDSNSLLFQNSRGLNSGLLGFDVDGNIWQHEDDNLIFSRSFNSERQPSDNYKNATTLQNFTSLLETGGHNAGHRFIGGDMVTRYSPIDPIFYIHHAMVDKAWADWYNDNPNADVSILDNTMNTFSGYPVSVINAETIVNPRESKLWYAYQNLLKLDNYRSSDKEKYRYTTGDIKATNFITPNNSKVTIVATSENKINLDTGFHAQRGSEFFATIENTASKELISEPVFVADNIENAVVDSDRLIRIEEEEQQVVNNPTKFFNYNYIYEGYFSEFSTNTPTTYFDESSILIAIYPNPTTENAVYINFSSQFKGKGKIELFDLSGKLILNKDINSNNQKINLINVETGIYIIKIYNNDALILTKKLSKF